MAHDVCEKHSWKVRLVSWKHEPCLIDLGSELMATARLRHLHIKPCRLGPTHHVISRPQMLHVILLRINSTSLRKLMPISTPIKYVRNNLFASPSFPCEARRKDAQGTLGICIWRCWCLVLHTWHDEPLYPLENYAVQLSTVQNNPTSSHINKFHTDRWSPPPVFG